MGKKVKKKSRDPIKEKQIATHSPKVVPDKGALVVVERKPCLHLGKKGVDLNELSAKLKASGAFGCQDCREGAADRRRGQGKGKHGKKKGGAYVDSKSDSKAIWICLACGHCACGGVGFPTTPQSHIVRHTRLTRHPLAIQLENPNLRWCFPCDLPVPVVKAEENGENNDVLVEAVKLIKERTLERSSVDVEDVWFGGGSVTSEIQCKTNVTNGLKAQSNYMIRGLVNLGNTCFFNSIMQNLLTMGKFFKLNTSSGPLNTSLKKLFAETQLEVGSKQSINPRSFFGTLTSVAPQFKGYQQHDSHELLRCLLDALSAEELARKRRLESSQANCDNSNQNSTFVESVFGGQISSTVCCLECGHSSTVYEPFLDLSLPVPTKKPPSKKAQPVSRAKKAKLPPKRGGRPRVRVNKDTESVLVPSASSESSSLQESNISPDARKSPHSGDSTKSESTGVATVAGEGTENCLLVQEAENEQVSENRTEQKTALDNIAWLDYLEPTEQTTALPDNFAWLDYLELGTASDGHTSQDLNALAAQDSRDKVENITNQTVATSENSTWLDFLELGTGPDKLDLISQGKDDVLVIEAPGNKDRILNNSIIQNSSQCSGQICSFNTELNLKPKSSGVNPYEDENPLQVQDSEVLLLPYEEGTLATGEITKEEAEVSSSAGQDEIEFDGFGSLFNEPEIAEGPVNRPLIDDNITQESESGKFSSSWSESDPDEVDNSDSEVSVESCLAYFVKPERLSNENAWHCENCSKVLQHQRLALKKNKAKRNTTKGSTSQIDSPSQDEHTATHARGKNSTNGSAVSNNGITNSNESLASLDGLDNSSIMDCSKANTLQIEGINPGFSPRGGNEIDDDLSTNLHSSSCDNSCHQASIIDQTTDLSPLDGTPEYESYEMSDDEMDSKSFKVKRDATKRVLIHRTPPVLTIHLKRFSQDARGRLSKLNGHVNFRETINLRSYLDPRCTDREKYEYQLVGVVEHLGTMRGGHYVAYVKVSQKSIGEADKENVGSAWFHASDTHIRKVTLEDVLRSEAYILFYEKIQV